MKKPQIKASKAMKLYSQYEYLADFYAKKVFSYQKAGYEYQDILQEFRIKIYTAIQAYGRKWLEYKRTGRYKPIPIQIYLKSALSNRLQDFIKQLNSSKLEAVEKESFDHIDIGMNERETMNFSMKNCVLYINGIDICEGLKTKDEKRCFLMYTQGFSMSKLQKTFKNKFKVNVLIKNHIETLQLKKNELYDIDQKRYETFSYETEQL